MDQALLTITGLEARILKLLVGTPFLLVGAVAILVGLGESGTTKFAALGIGAVVGLVGVLAFVSAATNDEVTIGTGGDAGGT